jgi:hypothetical protein
VPVPLCKIESLNHSTSHLSSLDKGLGPVFQNSTAPKNSLGVESVEFCKIWWKSGKFGRNTLIMWKEQKKIWKLEFQPNLPNCSIIRPNLPNWPIIRPNFITTSSWTVHTRKFIPRTHRSAPKISNNPCVLGSKPHSYSFRPRNHNLKNGIANFTNLPPHLGRDSPYLLLSNGGSRRRRSPVKFGRIPGLGGRFFWCCCRFHHGEEPLSRGREN